MSNNLSEPPIAIMVTLPKRFFEDRDMTLEAFDRYFSNCMSKPDNIWNYRLTNLPKNEVLYVYFVFGGQIQYRLNFVMYQRSVAKIFNDTPNKRLYKFPPSNWIICTGPAIKAPRLLPKKGFQGFRYCKEIF